MNNWSSLFDAAATPRWLVLDLNSFFASCEQQDRPHLRKRPVIVVPGRHMTTCAIAASYEAKAYGICTGTLVKEALALCPGLELVEANHKTYVQYHHRIIAAIETCASVERVMSIDEVAVRLDRVQRQPEAALALARAMKAAIREQVGECLTSSIGIAGNVMLAKLGSDMKKPDGLTLLLPENLPHAIAHLELSALPGIGPNMAIRLKQHGINDVPALWAAPPERLRRIWGGVTGIRFHALLHGADLDHPTHPRRSMSHQHVMSPDSRAEGGTETLRRLTVNVAARLRKEGFYCRRLSVAVKWDLHEGHWHADRNVTETQDTPQLLETLAAMLARMPRKRPLRVGVVASRLVPAAAHQADLFARAPKAGLLSAAPQYTTHKYVAPRSVTLSTVIDRLNTRFAGEVVGYGHCAPPKHGKIAFNRVPDLWEF